MATTKKFLQAKVDRLNQTLGRSLEPHRKGEDGRVYGNEGHIMLDHAPIYGGYILYEMCESTGVRNFGISRRISAKEMDIYLDGIFAGLELVKGN